MINKTILIVAPKSIHSLRFVNAIKSQVRRIFLITNAAHDISKIETKIINFSFKNICATGQIRTVIKQIKPEIIHIHQANSYAYHTIRAIPTNFKTKIILTAWGSDILINPLKNWFLNYMVKFNLTHVNLITSDSLYMSAQIAKLLAQSTIPIKTINFGIKNFPAKIYAHKKKIILSNRLHKNLYNIDKIIIAFSELLKIPLYTDYQLLIAGSGDNTEFLIELIDKLQLTHAIKILGMLDYSELINYYQSAQILISIPDSDATSLSVLEGMAYGLIPILSNIPANLEWIIDGFNGIIQDHDLLTALVQAIELSQNHVLYNELQQFNYRLIKQKALFEHNINKFLDLYR